ncbi:MAG: YitT family protein [Bacteroidaceae bacterium]|nr:YitT family protein [Bacteroidaceae bacterium]MBQ8455179.1 YitT family protein [Bacteroidaceae bacterium]MBQ9169720.1 YitT family protein [Bacteroidaceae bacterium]MBQ9295349.1 YitT family protein [Bacteroidaceae bacterium]
MPKVNYRRIWEFTLDFLAINLGMAIYALGWAAFLLPYHITTGGMTGMFAILYYLTKFPISAAVLIANAILLIIALKPLGWKFVGKTAYAAIALSSFLELGQQMMTGDDGQLMQILGEGQDSMACVLGAILNGLGIGIVFLTGGSTGGWDIIAALVNKYRNISFGRALLILDFVVIASCWPIFHDVRMVVFGYVTLVVYTYALDMLINSARQDIQFIIFTRKPDEISQRIISETCHSVTSMDGVGYYSHQDIKVLITIVHKRESVKILRMIQETDPAAFVSQSRAEGVYGNGFNAIKP